MKILALETSGNLLSIACLEKERVRSCFESDYSLRQSELMIPKIMELIEQAGWNFQQLQVLAVAIGPGSFTGIRTGLGFVKGAALGLGAKVCGVPTLDAWAYSLGKEFNSGDKVTLWIDALKNQVYRARYEYKNKEWHSLKDSGLLDLTKAKLELNQDDFLCSGFENSLITALPNKKIKRILPLGQSVGLAAWKKIKAGEFDQPAWLDGLYVRRAEAEIVLEKKQNADKTGNAC
jgi:tRNA threonylcarbamoyladenosine biosynthesis protein TsaB